MSKVRVFNLASFLDWGKLAEILSDSVGCDDAGNLGIKIIGAEKIDEGLTKEQADFAVIPMDIYQMVTEQTKADEYALIYVTDSNWALVHPMTDSGMSAQALDHVHNAAEALQ